MPLDIDALYRQAQDMVRDLPEAGENPQLAEAQRYLCRADPQLLRQKLLARERATAKIPWLVAAPVDTHAGVYPAPPLFDSYTVVAADGSPIPPDRHSPVRYFVVNFGHVELTYGARPHAEIASELRLSYTEEDLYFDPQDKRIPIEGTRLGIHMSVGEMVALRGAARDVQLPAVALRDGSLILWQLQSRDEDPDLCAAYLERFLSALEDLRQQDIPVASYVSYPGSHDVANSLRLMLCDYPDGCRRCPQATDGQRLCRFIGTLVDRQLYQGLLSPGERSDVFESQSAILSQYGAHRVRFFYLDVGGEIARVEAPLWVMEDPEMRDAVHGIVYDQCQRSAQYPPYPAVLIEAHEAAVISTGGRQVVEEMMARLLASKGYPYLRSAKDHSKRSRGV
ncbi:MAG: DNA double-strand break repair nuclease NurA [Anaerolineae bacterium]